jgi:DNA polymerase III delta subunit
MTFAEFRRYRPKNNHNVFAFICEDDFLLEESRAVWSEIFGPNWVFEKLHAKEFDEIEGARLMDEALTPSLFSQTRVLLVANAEKVSKKRSDDLTALQGVTNSSLKVILIFESMKTAESWAKTLPVVVIDPLKPADVARWLMERYSVSADVARYVVESAGTELYPLHNEMEKLKTYLGNERSPEIRDIDASLLRSEKFGPWELDDAILARDYNKAVHVVGAMIDEGVEPQMILAKIVRVWRQLFIGKGVSGKKGANDVAAAAGVPGFKANAFAASCRKYGWPQLAGGFREILTADRAFKTSSPNREAYFDILLWKLVGN